VRKLFFATFVVASFAKNRCREYRHHLSGAQDCSGDRKKERFEFLMDVTLWFFIAKRN